MRIYISADLEGIAGVVHGDQCHEGGKDYDRARRWMTQEVSAAVQGALDAGASDVLVNDAHGSMRNLLYEELHPKATLISGTGKPLQMMEGIDDSYDAVFLIGYHARMGQQGILNHTISGGTVGGVWVNGLEVGETGINSFTAGHFGVPVVLVTGDHCLAAEAQELMPWVKTVAVKRAISRYAAASLPRDEVRDLIRQRAHEAVANLSSAGPLRTQEPVEFRLRFRDTAQADKADILSQVRRQDPLTLAFQATDYLTGVCRLRALIGLGR